MTTSATVDRATLEWAGAVGACRVVINLGSADLAGATDELRHAAERAQLTRP